MNTLCEWSASCFFFFGGQKPSRLLARTPDFSDDRTSNQINVNAFAFISLLGILFQIKLLAEGQFGIWIKDGPLQQTIGALPNKLTILADSR